MNYKKAIIVLAYNRPNALQNLLDSLTLLKTDEINIPLIISIDNRGTTEVNQIANAYKWPFGEKKVIIHEEKLGLKKHFFYSGDITEEYENIVFLEDDLLVSPYMLTFCDEYLEHYCDDDRVSGASLYNPILKEGTGCKYYQLEDGSDVYFLQQPYWGNVWSKHKWALFREWYKGYSVNETLLPNHVAKWRDTSFKKVYIQYLIETDRYFVTPRISLLTNNGEVGLHNTIAKYQYQCNVEVGKRSYRMPSLFESNSVYDAFFEISPTVIKRLNPNFEPYDFYVDIYKQKHRGNAPYCLSTRQCNNALFSFSRDMKPIELSVVLKVKGEGLSFAETTAFDFGDVDRSTLLYQDITDNYMVDFKASKMLFFEKIKNKLKHRGVR